MKEIKFEDGRAPRKRSNASRCVEARLFPAVIPTRPKDPMTGGIQRSLAGEKIELPIDEARKIIKLGIAERADRYMSYEQQACRDRRRTVERSIKKTHRL